MSSITKKAEYGNLKNTEFQQLFRYTENETLLGVIEYANGDVYMGEIKPDENFDDKRDRRRHGYGKVISKRGKTVEGEWHLGLVIGKSVTFDKKGQRTVEVRGSDPSHRSIMYSYLLTDDGKYGGDKYNGLYKDKFWKGDFEDVLRRGELRERLFGGNLQTTVSPVAQDGGLRIEKAPPQKSAPSKEPARLTETKRIEFNNGVYEGEVVNGKFHGYGVYRWNSGSSYEGEWKDGCFHGHGVFRWEDGDAYDGEWKDDKRHGNGKWIYADGSYYTGVWENGENISASETYPAPSDTPLYIPTSNDADDCSDDDDGFESMTDYYVGCMDPASDQAYIFDAPSSHDLLPIDDAVQHIIPFFNQVLNCFEEGDPGTAQEFLAEIVQVDANTLCETFTRDGMFEKDAVDTFDVCDGALKCAFVKYVECQDENTYLATLHFAYFLHKVYSELNGYRCSGLFAYYLSLYLTYGMPLNDQAKDLGALYLARLFETANEYMTLDSSSDYYELEERCGELLTKILDESGSDITLNVDGSLINPEAYVIYHKPEMPSFVFKSGSGTFTLEDDSTFVGYADAEGRAYGWGAKRSPEGNITKGFWKNGALNGFGMYVTGPLIYAGNYKNGFLDGFGFRYNTACGINDYPIESVYFKDGESGPNPDFGPDQRGSSGRYSSTMQYFGRLDSAEYAHGWCCLWSDDDDPKYYAEGIYEHGKLLRGFRAWLRGYDSVEWAYGSYIRNADKTGYLLNSTPAFPIGQKGRFSVKNGEIELEFYDRGEFKNNYLNGMGTRVFSDGLSISGYFINGGVARILSVTLPNGEAADPADYSHYLSKKHSAEIIWDELTNMRSAEEKDEFFANCPILIVPKGIKKIPDYMFNKCLNLKGVYFNEDLEEIGKNAFAWCKNLGPVLKLPQGIKRIGPSAFSVCSGIKVIHLPNYVWVGEWAFMCGVDHVVFETEPPRGIVLEKGAFSECDITMPKEMIKKIKDINRKAFR